MNLTQRQLLLFTTAAQTLNVTQAARRVHLSQPAFTRALQALEQSLGLPLFRRTTRELALTEDGRRFLPTAQRLLGDLEQAVLSLRDPRATLRSTVTVAVGTAFACTILPAIVRAYGERYPGVRVRIRDDNSEGIAARVARGEADLGIASLIGKAPELAAVPLLSAPLGVLAPARYPLPARPSAARLAGLPLIKEADDTSIMGLLRQHGSALVTAMEAGTEVSSLAVQLALVRADAGVAVVSALGAAHPYARGLRFVPLVPAVRRDILLLTRRDAALRPPARALAEAIVAALRRTRLPPGVRLDAAVTR